MGLFRRSRPLHERLAEEADLDIGKEPRAPSAFSGFLHEVAADMVGIHGVSRPRQWDVVASAAADLPGDQVHFVALPDGTLVVDEDVPDGSLLPLAEAVEGSLRPPYRAEGVRHDERVWAVGGRRIQVRELPGHHGNEVELVEDGLVIVGRRLEGDLFEVSVNPL